MIWLAIFWRETGGKTLHSDFRKTLSAKIVSDKIDLGSVFYNVLALIYAPIYVKLMKLGAIMGTLNFYIRPRPSRTREHGSISSNALFSCDVLAKKDLCYILMTMTHILG